MPDTPDQREPAEIVETEECEDREQDEQTRFRAKRARVGRVAFIGFLVILAALGIYAVWPWLVPPFIYEGPMVQVAGETDVTLVWYMTCPTDGDGLLVRIAGEGPEFPVECADRRCRAVLTGLEPGQAYPYSISLGRRELARAAFRTNKPAGEAFTFIVFGDSGRGSRAQYRIAAQMTAADPDFLLHTGDVVYGRGERSKYKERFFTPYDELLQHVNLWPSLGNHDVAEPDFGRPYLEVFELPENGPEGEPPERNYWFDYAAARIAIVDSNIDEAALRDHVAPWLRDVFTACEALWKFVVFHHPPYTGGAYQPDERIQRTLVPMFEETGVDVVFNGHDHMYQRMYAIRDGQVVDDGAGVVYVVSGAGGARLYEALPPEQRPPYVAALKNEIHSFTLVSITGDQLELQQIAVDGAVLDTWSLVKQEPPVESP